MKTTCIILFLFLFNAVFAQDDLYPTLNKSYRSVRESVPKDWVLMDSVSADLNRDQIADFVVILESEKTTSEPRPNGSTIITRPRILIIFFKNIDGSLDLKLQHNTFLLRNGEDMRYEVYPRLTIKERVLSIHYDLFHDYLTFKFRFQNDNFYLIGATIKGIHGGAWSEEDINFNTKKFHSASYFVGKETEKKIKRVYLKDLKPIRMEDFKMPLTYKLPGDYML